MIDDSASFSHTPNGSDRPSRPVVALAHDWLVSVRGGELVLEEIAKLVQSGYTPAGLYTMFMDSSYGRDKARVVPRATLDLMPTRVSLCGRSSAALKLRRWMLPVYPAMVHALSRQLAADHAQRRIDVLLSTSSAAIKGLRVPKGVRHICYCHAPARYLWGQEAQYAAGSGGLARSLGLKMLGPSLRRWDRSTAANVDVFIANSRHVQTQIKRVYGRDAVVVHPPVDVQRFGVRTRAPWSGESSGNTSGNWLYAGALEPYKRVDLVIQAARLAGAKLVIAGGGSQLSSIRALAAKDTNVLVRGAVSDAELAACFHAADVLVQAQVEDFGIVAVEAQACGTPVVAFAEGGSQDTVIDGRTGVLFQQQTAAGIVEAVGRMRDLVRREAVVAACRTHAERFGPERFAQEMTSVIDRQ